MPSIAEIINYLEVLAPPILAEEWDNVGLIVGDRARETSAVMTCLTLTPDVAAEAVKRQVGLVVSHHPILFQPVQKLTADTTEGRMLLELIGADVAVYSPHTAYDSARTGINQQLAEQFQLSGIEVLRPFAGEDEQAADGAGRCGTLPRAMPLKEFVELVKTEFGVECVQYVGVENAMVSKVGLACGSAAEFLRDAYKKGCQVLLTGEARFHACFEATALEMGLVLVGHYASERPAVERLAEILQKQFPKTDVWASESETDPLKWMG